MKFDDMQFSLSAVQWLLMAVIGVYTWMAQRASASSAEVAKVNAEVALLRERVVALEVDMKNMPSEATVRELIGQLASLQAYHEGTTQQLNSMQHSVNRLHDFLLNKKG